MRVAARFGALLIVAALCAILLGAAEAGAVVLPSGFRDSVVFSDLSEPSALRFAADGRIFVAEKKGEILVYEDLSDPTPTVFADLRKEVYDSGDRGLLGLALDPRFTEGRPYLYALYTYDHVLGDPGPAPRWGEPPEYTGDPCPKPADADVDACPVSGRLVRLTADGDEAQPESADPAEVVLVEDWCQQFSSHSVGNLAFGPEGALYASGGDGANFNGADFGQFGWPEPNQCGDPPAGIGGAESPPDAEGGALRAQDLRTPMDPLDPAADPTGLDGSLIRVDPDDGAGLADNPGAASTDANERRVVAYGFRNPFRFAVDPAGGEIYVGNVGWDSFEEIDRLPAVPTSPFDSGWPCYEGVEPTVVYRTLGLTLCDGLYAEAGSTSPPFFSYGHDSPVIPEDPCSSEPGSAVSGMAVYRGGAFPAAYDGALFFADSVRGCIYTMHPDDDGMPDPQTTTAFMSGAGLYPGIDLQVGPEGDLYYTQLFDSGEEGSIHRISFDPSAPVARLGADVTWGAADPLPVELDASESSDPEGEPLSYEWDLDGDGIFETDGGATRSTAVAGPGKRVLAVRVDDGTESSIARINVYPGDTPPRPEIELPLAGTTWGVGQTIELFGFADDDEESGGAVSDAGLYWKTRLLHCPSACHAHPLQVFPADGEVFFVAPDHGFPSSIEVLLTATDSEGLSATVSKRIDAREADIHIGSHPAGLTIGAGEGSEATPFVLPAIEGAHTVLSAPAEATLSGRQYDWSGWSDGGARTHTIVAGAEPGGEYVAEYAPRAGEPEDEPADEESGSPDVPDAETAPTTAGTEGASPSRLGRPVLRRHPPRRSHRRFARFVFTATVGSVVEFGCRLDATPYRICGSRRIYRHLRCGRHAFRVWALDGDGRRSRPRVFRWRAC